MDQRKGSTKLQFEIETTGWNYVDALFNTHVSLLKTDDTDESLKTAEET